MNKIYQRAWVEINLDNITHNLKEIKKHFGENVLINGVIKADGYGHGAIMTAKTLCKNGIDMLSVATLDEAIQLRNKDINIPILLLGYIDKERIEEIIENDLIISIFNENIAHELSKGAASTDKKIKCHIKIDTGMNRIGFKYSEEKKILDMYSLKGLDIKGIFTHYSTSDEKDTDYTNLQYARFSNVIEKIKSAGVNPGICHGNNSGAVILHPDKAMDMVRTGILLYGLYPSERAKLADRIQLKPAMTFKAKIIQIKKIKKGLPVSYGNKYITDKETVVATISCGYADGYSRSLSGKTSVLIKGKKAPLIGNICMDMCMADITSINETIQPGDEAILFNGEITAGEIAQLSDTINYEIICRIGTRIPRVYIQDGKIIKISNYLL